MLTKYIVILLNIVMLVVGALVLTLGIWGMNVGSQVSHLVSLSTPTLVMILGVVILLLSLWGMYAAVNEDPLLMQIVHYGPIAHVIVSWRHDLGALGAADSVEYGACSSKRH
jgi:energy-converting hydrogenase Eha subunit A